MSLQRFLDAQAPVIDTVMAELRAGRKRSHWMWFVFPQLAALGRSATAKFYGIESLDEARRYVEHPVLGPRLLACVEAVLAHAGTSAHAIFGSPDDLKFRSCLTLFGRASPRHDAFGRALAAFYDGEDPLTAEWLQAHPDPGARVRTSPAPGLREARAGDLDAINAVVERAVMSWRLPERVKRLAMPTYRYGPVDLAHMGVVVAEDGDAGVVGVAAWEEAARRDCPRGRRALLLQGIYVDPDRHRRGLGARLLAASAEAARRQGLDGVLVKAQPDAIGFFEAQGLSRLPVEDPERDYPHRYWLDISPRASG